MSITLRDYQSEALDKTIDYLRNGKKRPLIVLPTGAGKTSLASEFIRRSNEKGKSSIFVCHRQELLYQTYNTYRRNDIMPAIIKSGISPSYDNHMQIAIINTLSRRLDKVSPPDIIFWDECSHIASTTWKQVFDKFPKAVHIGLTATPCRLDGKPLDTFFDCMVSTVTTNDLISRGFLVPYQYYAPSNIDTSELKVSNGKFTKKSLAHASFSAKIIGDNIEQYCKLGMGKRNIVFAINRMHGQEILERYRSAGIPSAFLDNTTPDGERKRTVKDFADGKVLVLINVDLFSEGFDVPQAELVSLLRPTQSLSLYLQQIGRVLRTSPETGKQRAIILDHVNNYQRHGMPDDEREWSLSDGIKVKRTREQTQERMMRCPECFFAHDKALICPNCGYEYAKNDDDKIKEIAGELVLIGSAEHKVAQKKELLIANSLDDLVLIEKDRGYKFGWAEQQWKLKKNEDLWRSFDGIEKIAKARGYDNKWVWVQKHKIKRR